MIVCCKYSRWGFVLAESVWVMQSVYKLDRASIVEILEVLINNPIFIFDRQILSAALQMYIKKSSVSFIDCFLVAQTKAQKTTPFLTFDVNLQKLFIENK